MKRYIIIVIFMLLGVSIYSKGSSQGYHDAKNKTVVGLVLNQEGLGDRGINDSCYLGLEKASEEGIITLRVKNTDKVNSYKNRIEGFVSEGVNIIYIIGEENKKILIDSAVKYQKTIFIGVDIILKNSEMKPNLYAINFKEQEGGYLAGVVAGNMTYKFSKRHTKLNQINKVGIILGNNSSPNRRYELGYIAGVKSVNPSCEIISVNIDSLNDPKKGSNAVLDLKEKGVDIIFTTASKSDYGVFSQAESSGLFVIASNRDLGDSSDAILTSVVKKLQTSTYILTKDIIEQKQNRGTNVTFGVDNGSIELAPYYKYDKYISKDLRDEINKSMSKLSKNPEYIPNSKAEIIFDTEVKPEFETEY